MDGLTYLQKHSASRSHATTVWPVSRPRSRETGRQVEQGKSGSAEGCSTCVRFPAPQHGSLLPTFPVLVFFPLNRLGPFRSFFPPDPYGGGFMYVSSLSHI